MKLKTGNEKRKIDKTKSWLFEKTVQVTDF